MKQAPKLLIIFIFLINIIVALGDEEAPAADPPAEEAAPADAAAPPAEGAAAPAEGAAAPAAGDAAPAAAPPGTAAGDAKKEGAAVGAAADSKAPEKTKSDVVASVPGSKTTMSSKSTKSKGGSESHGSSVKAPTDKSGSETETCESDESKTGPLLRADEAAVVAPAGPAKASKAVSYNHLKLPILVCSQLAAITYFVL